MMDAVSGFATLVWPPTGISLAALLLFGYRYWPAVLVGALTTNLLAGAPVLVALAIAAGNTLEALAGTYTLRRIPGFRTQLDRVRDVIAFLVLAALASTAVSATIGVTSLYLGGIVSGPQAAVTWRAWWLGDVIGDLLVAPLLLTWVMDSRVRVRPARLLEAAVIVALMTGAILIVFSGPPSADRAPVAYAYMVFPPLVWTALRFEQRGTVTALCLISLVAIYGTYLGRGPFVRATLSESLFALQTFMAVATATFLVLAASIMDRLRAEDELRRARDAAAEANRAKSDFLAVVSHELRTPLNAISGYVDLIGMELEGPVTPRQREFLSRIQRNGEHLLSLIDDVLSFARIEAGRLPVSPERIRVADALAGLQPLVEPEIRRKELTFTCDGCEPSLAAVADTEKLRQILLNLVSNSIKFTGAGGRVSIGAEQNGKMVRIWVADTGIGIPADQLARVFEPFFQAERGMTRRFPGIGLGLSIARDLARAMHGDLRLESSEGVGSTASLLLPVG